MQKKFEICVRGVIIRKDRILICRNKKNKNWFFPGGHVEFGEKANAALVRELKEEIGASIGRCEFIGATENLYRQRGKNLHEINIVFKADLGKKDFRVLEDHLEFKWANLGSLPRLKVYPTAIKNSVSKWRKDKKIFWESQGFKN